MYADGATQAQPLKSGAVRLPKAYRERHFIAVFLTYRLPDFFQGVGKLWSMRVAAQRNEDPQEQSCVIGNIGMQRAAFLAQGLPLWAS